MHSVTPPTTRERLLTILTAVAVLMSLMVIYADPALAHHPEVSAFQTCIDRDVYIHYDAVSWKTDGTSGSGHSDIRIEVRVNGAGSWDEVASGAFNAGNSYSFSGDLEAATYWGDSIEVRARSVGPWDNGVAGGQTWITSPIFVNQDCFNPSCPDQYHELKIEPVPDGQSTYGPSSEFSIDVYDSANGEAFDWTATVPVYQVIVKGGPGANVYNYGPATSDTGLHAPENSNGTYYGLSHITFCYGDPLPETVTVVVTHGDCIVDGQAIPGSVTVTIDPQSGATVQVTGPGGPYDFSGSGGSQTLAPGDYSWTAIAADGFTLTGDTSGDFTVDPCNSSVVVSHNQCDVNSSGAPVGSVDVTIDPDSGATVYVYDDAAMQPADLVATFTGTGGSQDLAPGTYYWDAEAGANFTLTGDSSGSFTIDPCEGAVVVASGECVIVEGVPFGSVSVTIDPDSSATVYIYDDPDMDLEDLVVTVTGSGDSTDSALPGTYYWEAVAGEGFTLTGDTSGSFTIEPCEGSVAVASGECVINDQGAPSGSVTVTIAVDGSATVNIHDSDTDALVASFDGTGGSDALAPGGYYWEAVAADGFELTEPTSGEFTIEPCDVAVVAAGGECVVTESGVAVGEIQVSINPDTGATVTIYDSDNNPVASFTQNGTVALDPGDYTWSAVPGSGFEMTGATSGELTIEPCEATVTAGGECLVGSDGASGVISVALSDGIEKVDIRDGGELIGTLTDSGSLSVAEGKTYTWLATVADGFAVSGDIAGSIDIEDCVIPASLLVTHGDCVEDTLPNGYVQVVMQPGSSAVVTVLDDQDMEAVQFSSSGAAGLPPGDYTWTASTAAGFDSTGSPASGSFTIEPCPDEVLAVEVLPFTGLDVGNLAIIGLVFLIAGWYALSVTRRREES